MLELTAVPVLFAAVLAALISLLLLPFVMRQLSKRQLVDEENERSSHTGAILRGGGVGPLVGIVGAGCFATATFGLGGQQVVALAAVAGFGILGFVDDVRDQSPILRLGAQVVLASVAVSGMDLSLGVDSRPLSIGLAVLWTVGIVNAFNFMDGINGISGVTALVAGTSIAGTGLGTADSSAGLLGAVAGGAALGFLPFNFPRAKVFLGDVGSYSLGASLAFGSLLVVDAGAGALTSVAPLLLYVADVGFTLTMRTIRGASPLAAHREHAYQRRAAGNWGHTYTTIVAGAVTMILALFGLAAGSGSLVAAIAGIVAAGSVGWFVFGAPSTGPTENYKQGNSVAS